MDKNISKDDIIEYWLSLYPEFKDEKELDYQSFLGRSLLAEGAWNSEIW